VAGSGAGPDCREVDDGLRAGEDSLELGGGGESRPGGRDAGQGRRRPADGDGLVTGAEELTETVRADRPAGARDRDLHATMLARWKGGSRWLRGPAAG
jgi:hypothetical protein